MAWLKEKNAEHEYRDILKEPPTKDELAALAKIGNTTIVGLLNPKSTGLKALGVDLQKIDDAEAADIIFKNPKTMIRPLFTDGKRISIGFNVEDFEQVIS